MSEALRFPVFVLASLVAFFAILRFVTRRRPAPPSLALLVGIAGVVVVGGMVFAKFGQNAGWPWWIYYTVPALATLVLAALSSPVIHVLFSLLLGWHDYMPFIRVPSLQEILSSGQAGI